MDSSPPTTDDRALAGIRVLDLGHVLAAPTAGMILADLGAEVIHVEPPGGDDAREFGPFVQGQSAYFISVNRNKKSVVLDLKKPAGKDVLRDLIRVSDVLLENYRADTMTRLGFSYAALQELNPRLIYGSITGFGHDALPDYVGKPAYDMVAQAFSGLMSITGPEGGPPVRVGASIGDILSGHQCAIGILSALWHRERTGRGQQVDIAMVDALVYALENAVVRYTVRGEVPGPLGTRHPSLTPFQAFQTADGWITLAIGNDALWKKLCVALGQQALGEDARFCSVELRARNVHALNELLAPLFLQQSTAAWMQFLEAHGLPYSPINSVADIVQDANTIHRQMIVEIEQPGVGPVRIVGSPFHLSETPGQVRQPAPLLGQHTAEVLREILGYTPERIAELLSVKAVYAAGESPDGSPSGWGDNKAR